eukprot:2979047-Pleurochrysis_carterae.AAC.1
MENRRPRDRLTILQKALMNAAAEVGWRNIHENNTARDEEEDRYDRREEQQLNKEERARERKRHQVFK